MKNRNNLELALRNEKTFEAVFQITVDFVAVAKANKCDKALKLLNYLFKHQKQFDRIVRERANLVYIARELPDFSDLLIDFVLQHPKEFSRLVKSQTDLDILKEKFPSRVGIFGKANVKEAQLAVNELYHQNHHLTEIKRIAAILYLEFYNRNSSMNKLPAELVVRIASLCAEPSQLPQNMAYNTAYLSFK